MTSKLLECDEGAEELGFVFCSVTLFFFSLFSFGPVLFYSCSYLSCAGIDGHTRHPERGPHGRGLVHEDEDHGGRAGHSLGPCGIRGSLRKVRLSLTFRATFACKTVGVNLIRYHGMVLDRQTPSGRNGGRVGI